MNWLLKTPFAPYILAGVMAAAFLGGWTACGWHHDSQDKARVNAQIEDLKSRLERAQDRGRTLQLRLEAQRQEAERHVSELRRIEGASDPLPPVTRCLFLAALDERSPADCQRLPDGADDDLPAGPDRIPD